VLEEQKAAQTAVPGGQADPASRCLRETGHLLLAIRLEPHLWPRLTDVSAAPATEGAGSSAAAPTRDDDPWLRRLVELRREAVAQMATTADDLTDEQAQRLAAFRLRDGA